MQFSRHKFAGIAAQCLIPLLIFVKEVSFPNMQEKVRVGEFTALKKYAQMKLEKNGGAGEAYFSPPPLYYFRFMLLK